VDEIEVVARGIYRPVMRGAQGKWFDSLPEAARGFLKEQAKGAMEALRVPSEKMLLAGVAVCDLEAPEIEGIWEAMSAAALKDGMQ
jgi:hypothetical protein